MSNTKIKASQFHGVVGHGTDGYFLMTNADGSMSWSQASTGPSVTSVTYPGDDTAADPAGGQTVVLTGTGFGASGMTVSIGGTTAPSVAHDSNTQLTITTPAKAAGDYDIVVTNSVTGASGTFVNGISYNGVPTWTTAAGSLGTFESETTISTITLQATEPDGGTITFNITNGALPTGLSLTGANIDGTTTAESSTTLYSFTIEAIDDENQSTPRNFSITVNAAALVSSENFTINTYTGNGSTQSIEGKIGTAAEFNGSSSYITAGDWGIQGGAAHTVSFWVNFKSTAAQFVYGIGDTVTSFTHTSLRFDTSLTRAYLDNNGGAYIYSTSLSLSTGTWYYITHTYDGSGTSELFIDGVSVGSQSVTLNMDGTAVIGRRPYYGSDYLNAKLDQFRVFNKKLSSSEITTLYGETNTSTTKSTTDIFDDGSGVALYEFEKGAIDTGGTNGYIGSAGIFNGSSSLITTPVNSDDVLGISMWIYFESGVTFQRPLGCNISSGNPQTYIEVGTNGTVAFSVKNTARSAGAGTLGSTGWKHLYIDSSGSFYLNGSSVSTSSVSFTGTTNIDLIIGALKSNFGFFNSKIDQVRFFSRALTSSEVTTLYGETSASATKSTTDIFDDGSGVALYELEGNANDSSGFKQVTMASTVTTSGGYVDAAVTSGKYYWEVLYSDRESTGSTLMVGVGSDTSTFWTSASNYFYYAGNGDKYTNSSQQSYGGATYTEGDIIGVALDLDGDTVTFYKNGVSQGQAFTGLSAAGGYYAMVSTGYNADSAIFYFDSNDWTYSAPSGYSEWTDAINASIVTLNGATLDTYNGTATNVSYAYDGTPTNVGFVGTSFQPDLVWIKYRNAVANHMLFDSARGVYKRLSSNTTDAEATNTSMLTSFDSNGFTLGSQTSVNANNGDYVAWCFKGGGTAVSNTDGTITSTVSANQDAGFSIVSYTGTNNSSDTVGHGLSSAPELIIIKKRNGTSRWPTGVWQSGSNISTNFLNLTTVHSFNNLFYVNTAPTNSVFTISGWDEINDPFNYIAYCFHSVDSYQKVGTYNGNGTDLSITGLGFQPRFLMLKRTDSTSNWVVFDSVRGQDYELYPNLSNAESYEPNRTSLDSDGFTVRSGRYNNSGSTFIYLAIA